MTTDTETYYPRQRDGGPAKCRILNDQCAEYLRDTGMWTEMDTPLLRWVDHRARDLRRDGRAITIGDAILRQIEYEAEGL
jgi:hypothetical protein